MYDGWWVMGDGVKVINEMIICMALYYYTILLYTFVIYIIRIPATRKRVKFNESNLITVKMMKYAIIISMVLLWFKYLCSESHSIIHFCSKLFRRKYFNEEFVWKIYCMKIWNFWIQWREEIIEAFLNLKYRLIFKHFLFSELGIRIIIIIIDECWMHQISNDIRMKK